MATVAKRPPLPAILLANDLLDVDEIGVELQSGTPVPRHFRERFKTLGPSNRPDLGKQAGDGIDNRGQA